MKEDELDSMVAGEAQRQSSEEGTTTEDNTVASQPTGEGVANQNDAEQQVRTEKPASSAADAAESNSPTAEQLQILDRLSGGKIKSVEDFTSILTKAEQTDVLSGKVKDFESKAAESPFADEYEAKRNELKKGGATKEQLKAFEHINDLGDLKELDPLEAIINKMILVDGIGPKVARIKAEKEFGLDGKYDEDLEVAEEDLRIASKKAIESLSAYRAQIATPNTDRVILDEAGKQALTAQLKPHLEKISTDFNRLTSVVIPAENGVAESNFDLPLDADSKAFIVGKVKEIMLEEGLQPTTENLQWAQRESVKDYLLVNLDKVVKGALLQQRTQLNKFYSEKYENTGGKPQGDLNPQQLKQRQASEYAAFENEMLGR